MKILVLAQTPPPVHGQSVMVATMVAGPSSAWDRDSPRADAPFEDPWRDWTLAAEESVRGAARRIPSPQARPRGIVRRPLLRPRPRQARRAVEGYPGLGSRAARRPAPRAALARAGARGLGPSARVAFRAPRGSTRPRQGGPLDRPLQGTLHRRAGLSSAPAGRRRQWDRGSGGTAAADGRVCVLDRVSSTSASAARPRVSLDTAQAVALLHRRRPNSFRLTFAGNFASSRDEQRFSRLLQDSGGSIRRVGFADEARKHSLYSQADIFCFPTRYPHEGQPIALIEAMAHDLRIVTTRWRAIPEMLPAHGVGFVEAGRPEALADALAASASGPPPDGATRRHFLELFSRQTHLRALSAALHSLLPD